MNRARYEAAREIPHVPVHACAQLLHRSLSPRESHVPAGSSVEDADAADLLPADDAGAARTPRWSATRPRGAIARRSPRLPQEQRDVYLLHEESDLSLEEIARVTGVGAETAKSRLRYAVGKLKAALSATEDLA